MRLSPARVAPASSQHGRRRLYLSLTSLRIAGFKVASTGASQGQLAAAEPKHEVCQVQQACLAWSTRHRNEAAASNVLDPDWGNNKYRYNNHNIDVPWWSLVRCGRAGVELCVLNCRKNHKLHGGK